MPERKQQFPLIPLGIQNEWSYEKIDQPLRQWNIEQGTKITHLRNQILESVGLEKLILLSQDKISVDEFSDNQIQDLVNLRRLAEEMAYRNKGIINKAIQLFAFNQDERDDLQQIGWISLVQSAQRYNPYEAQSETNFYAYAIRSIRGEFLNWHAQATGISKYEISHYYKYQKAQRKLEKKFSRDPITHERIVAMTLSHRPSVDLTYEGYWIKLQKLRSKEHLSEEETTFLHRQNQEEVYYWILLNAIKDHQDSLAVKYIDYHGESYDEYIPAEELVLSDEPSPEDYVNLQNFYTELNKQMLAKLTDREIKILTLRFGLDGYDNLTLAEVGTVLDLSLERVRQLEAKALRKLRQSSTRRNLHDYLDDNLFN